MPPGSSELSLLETYRRASLWQQQNQEASGVRFFSTALKGIGWKRDHWSPPASLGSAVFPLVISELFQLNAKQLQGFYSHVFRLKSSSSHNQDNEKYILGNAYRHLFVFKWQRAAYFKTSTPNKIPAPSQEKVCVFRLSPQNDLQHLPSFSLSASKVS